ncbi:MAG: hypothetical protein AABW93_03865 [Nanoarchaeota archaeon]
MNKRQKNRNFFSYDFFIKNRRGFLLAEETLKLIIAVIAIGFLAYLLFSLYSSSKSSRELGEARETLPFLMGEIKAGRTTVEIYNPDGWQLGTWPHEIEKGILFFKGRETQFPKTCSNIGLKSCICLCEGDNAESCDEEGVCLDNKGFLIEGNSIKIENPPMTLKINQADKKISRA